MIKVILDITTTLNDIKKNKLPYGIARVNQQYLEHYFDKMQVLIHGRKYFYLFSTKTSQKIAKMLLNKKTLSYKNLFFYMIQDLFLSNRKHNDHQYYLLKTDYGGLKTECYLRQLQKKNIHLISLVHDLIPIINQEYASPKGTQNFTKKLNLILKHAKGIIVTSNTVNQDLAAYVLSQNINSSPVLLSHLASSIKKNPNLNSCIIASEHYFITVGTLDARKNHYLLLNVWCKLIEKYGDQTPKLIIIGRRPKKANNATLLLDNSPALRKVVIESNANDEEMIPLLSNARALLFPTFAEGFGLPLVEAIQMKVPVIASNLSVFKEIAALVPEYISPTDDLAWMTCIEDYMRHDSELYQKQKQRISTHLLPTWEDHFMKVNAFIKNLQQATID